jgi:hypothetical protein
MQPTREESWLAERSPLLAAYVAGLRRRVGRRFSHQVRKLYDLCHEYLVVEVEPVVARAIDYDLFDVSRLEGILLQEYGARLFGFRKSGDHGGSTGGAVALVTPPSAPTASGNGATADSATDSDDDEEQSNGAA